MLLFIDGMPSRRLRSNLLHRDVAKPCGEDRQDVENVSSFAEQETHGFGVMAKISSLSSKKLPVVPFV